MFDKRHQGLTRGCAVIGILLALAGAGLAETPGVAAARDGIRAERISATVKALSDPRFGGRLPGSDGDQGSRDHIVERFREIGLQPAGTEGFLQGFETTIETEDGVEVAARTSNIIGILPGNHPALAEEVIIVSAHRDHLGQDATGRLFLRGE